jgi:hypothetical protein
VPKVVAHRPDLLVSIDLDGTVGRFDLAATAWGTVPCVSLVYRYIPPTTAVVAGGQLVDLSQTALVALARARVPFASDLAEVTKVVSAPLLGHGSLDADAARAEEALSMFRNGPRIRDADFQATKDEIRQVLDAWHQVVAWAMSGFDGTKTINAAGSALLLKG